jgi:hypothetical protein
MTMMGFPYPPKIVELFHPKKWWQLREKAVGGEWVVTQINYEGNSVTIILSDKESFLKKNTDEQ